MPTVFGLAMDVRLPTAPRPNRARPGGGTRLPSPMPTVDREQLNSPPVHLPGWPTP
ncbi:hypothetical protein [Actinocrispum sp. NPDC049592]|uniref:hypothetical protein n=1 Tax=Actinocrispum sp. NPDC049592 TaxID=3154835 RepID=UPI00342CE7B0